MLFERKDVSKLGKGEGLSKRAVSGIMLSLLLIGMLTLAFDIQPAKSEPTTIIVPDDYPTIQEAINHANEGDTIYVRAGIYYEKQATINKPLSILGENRNTTVIDGNGAWVCVYVQSTHNISISGFTIRNGFGICSYNSQNVTISGNIISNNGQGIILIGSTNNTISENIITLNSLSILLSDGSSDNKVCENMITLNSGDGVWLDNSYRNIICENEVSKNGLGTAPGYHVYGIRLSYSNNNSIYHNYIIDNYEQASGWRSVNNTWDDGYPSGGNYWSDYAGVDSNGDGIGDAPYVIDADNQDNYPLMSQWGPIHNTNTGLHYQTIQAAINAPETLEGHTVFVEAGAYYENVVVNKSLSLIGENRDNTVIDGNNETTPITILASGVNLSGFTLRNSSKLDPWFNDGTDGLYLEASNCTISHNIFSGNARGIRMYNSMNSTFYKNIITDNWADGFVVAGYCGGNTLDSNNVSSNGLGIVLYRNGYSNVLRNNKMTNNIYNFMVDPKNPALLDVDSSNTVNGKPIYFWIGKHDRRIPEDAGYVAIINSENLVVENLTLMNNGEGVLLYNSRNCSIRRVNVFNSLNGIMLYRSENCTIIDNTIVGCKGFLLCHSGFGIFLDSSENNRFYHNNVIDNEYQVLVDKLPWESYPNTWDNGCEGNYWSDYNGTDSDNDGVGDTPQVIDGNNTDHYPLMNPYWLPGDVNHDLKIDIYDVVRITGIYRSQQGDPNWNRHSDIAEPYGIIDIYDVVTCTKDYGKEYTP